MLIIDYFRLTPQVWYNSATLIKSVLYLSIPNKLILYNRFIKLT